jgi:hypothetical protein
MDFVDAERDALTAKLPMTIREVAIVSGLCYSSSKNEMLTYVNPCAFRPEKTAKIPADPTVSLLRRWKGQRGEESAKQA